jgi:hypothetical protein
MLRIDGEADSFAIRFLAGSRPSELRPTTLAV